MDNKNDENVIYNIDIMNFISLIPQHYNLTLFISS